jgi:hypothetical protein
VTAFFNNNRIKIVLGFAFAWPFLVVYMRSFMWWGSNDPMFHHLARASHAGPFPEFFFYFFPGIMAFALLPIEDRVSKTMAMAMLSFAYIVVMVMPIYEFSRTCYCMFNGGCVG